jgi:perosamine synthetase
VNGRPPNPLNDAAAELAPLYGKPFGVMVATGQAAIELSLELAGVVSGDEVVVPSECCHLVPAAVLRCGARPVFATSDRNLTIDVASVAPLLTERTRAVIAVHHLGLPCPTGELRRFLPSDVVIVEDAALAYGLVSRGAPVGESADFVVTSFGTAKPLSLGGGGAVFGDDEDLRDVMTRYGRTARGGIVVPRSFPLHPAAVADLPAAISAASDLVKRRREFVERIRRPLEHAGFDVWCGQSGDVPTWHRLPVWPRSPRVRQLSTEVAGWEEVVQQPHAVPLSALPMFGGIGGQSTPANADPSLFLRIDDPYALDGWLQRLVMKSTD